MAEGRRQAVVRAREVVLPWVHVWSAGMSASLKRALPADKVVTMYRNETRYLKLKGCYVRTASTCSARHRRAAARVQACLEGSASTRRGLHAARSFGQRARAAATGLHMVGIRQTPPTPDGTSPRSCRPGQRWASCEQCQCETPRAADGKIAVWCVSILSVLYCRRCCHRGLWGA